ncbi:MAG TPA: PadR family transcriptional regulator [Vicinamibacterales bacterium]|nr:PadR family transcriptional regulator [Vicinamibacterales bacterium]
MPPTPSLPPHDLHILIAVLDEPRHGYGIIQDVAARSGGETRLGTSTVYAALKRMLAARLIAETARPAQAGSEDERRRYYRATPLGREVARAAARDIDRLHTLVREARLLGRPRAPAARSRS